MKNKGAAHTLQDDLGFITEMNSLAPGWFEAKARVIRAVNTHEELLSCLKQVHLQDTPAMNQLAERIEKAVVKAEVA